MKKKMKLLKLVLPIATVTPALLSASCFGGEKKEVNPGGGTQGGTNKPETPGSGTGTTTPENPNTPAGGNVDKPTTQPVKYAEIINLFNSNSIFKKTISYSEFLKFTNQQGKETGRIDHYINNDGTTTIKINKDAAVLNEDIFSDELLKLNDFTVNFKKETDKVGFGYRDEFQKGYEIADENSTAENAKSSSSRLVFKVDSENETITILSVALYKYIPNKGLILLVPAEKDFVITVDQSTKSNVDNSANNNENNNGDNSTETPNTPEQPENNGSESGNEGSNSNENSNNNDVKQPSANLPENYESLSDVEKILYLYNNDLIFKKYISEEDFELLNARKNKRIDFIEKTLSFTIGGGNDRKPFDTDIFSDEANLIFNFTKNVKRFQGKIGLSYMDKFNIKYLNLDNRETVNGAKSASGRFVYETDAEKKTVTIKQLAIVEFSEQKGFKLYSELDNYKDFTIKVGTHEELESQENTNQGESTGDNTTTDTDKTIVNKFEEIKKSSEFNQIEVDINALPLVLQNILNKLNKVKTYSSEQGLEKINLLESKINESIEKINSLKNDKLPKIFKNHIDAILTKDNILKINQILEKSESEERLNYDSINIQEGNYLAVVQIITSIWEKTIKIVVDANNKTGTGATKLNETFIKATGAKLNSIYQKALTEIYADIKALNYGETKIEFEELVNNTKYLDYADELHSLKQFEILLNDTLTSSNLVLNKFKVELNALKQNSEANADKITSLNAKISSLQSVQFQAKTFLNSQKQELETLKSLTFDQLTPEQQGSLSSLKYKLMTLKTQLERNMK
ncbi:hypothetical protein [Mycoplasmopsis anatis]|uniref:hypothetical protein n=2 Tax=Mycoplasmopsis anatis TaxID=171279 RepID=UPI001C4E202C|nr:hypothetical protein [Mycoplasmopsis anatis]